MLIIFWGSKHDGTVCFSQEGSELVPQQLSSCLCFVVRLQLVVGAQLNHSLVYVLGLIGVLRFPSRCPSVFNVVLGEMVYTSKLNQHFTQPMLVRSHLILR